MLTVLFMALRTYCFAFVFSSEVYSIFVGFRCCSLKYQVICTSFTLGEAYRRLEKTEDAFGGRQDAPVYGGRVREGLGMGKWIIIFSSRKINPNATHLKFKWKEVQTCPFPHICEVKVGVMARDLMCLL